MVSVCFYFQVHQPERLKRYSVFEIGKSHDYFDHAKNKAIVEKVAGKCYLPMNRLLLKLIKEHHGKFKVSFSISGVALDQFERFHPEVLRSFQDLAKTGCVEFLGETHYHSLSFLYNKEEFDRQVEQHTRKIQELFGQTPKVFRNTELIFSNELANYMQRKGFVGVLAEGADHVLGWRSPNFLYTAVTAPDIKVLLKNYRLSDDVAFRFSDKGWKEHPLSVEKYVQWLNAVNGNGNVVNLFMDYETFGEHQWADTGIFQFMDALPREFLKNPDNDFKTPSEIVANYHPVGVVDMHTFVSWADLERDTSAWLGNNMQRAAIQELYTLRDHVYATGDENLIADWRRLTTSDHFYYMCTKWFSDGDVHKYFNPYDTPYDGYIAFMNVLNDLALRIEAPRAERALSLSERPSAVLAVRQASVNKTT